LDHSNRTNDIILAIEGESQTQ